jgi:hypothetical protein
VSVVAEGAALDAGGGRSLSFFPVTGLGNAPGTVVAEGCAEVDGRVDGWLDTGGEVCAATLVNHNVAEASRKTEKILIDELIIAALPSLKTLEKLQ